MYKIVLVGLFGIILHLICDRRCEAAVCYNGTVYSHLTDSSKYIVCLDDMEFTLSCPADLEFDPAISRCNWKNSAESVSAATTTQATTTNSATQPATASALASTTSSSGSTPTPPPGNSSTSRASTATTQTTTSARTATPTTQTQTPAVTIPAVPTRRTYLPATPCNRATCKLPNCWCAGSSIPNNIPRAKVPQMVMFTVDGSVTASNYRTYETLFKGQKNPNGCPQKATFFVSGTQTDYMLTRNLHLIYGHELADYTINRPNFKERALDYSQVEEEIIGMKANLLNKAQAKFVNGFRAPFLSLAGDSILEVLADNNFLYDSSLPARHGEYLWPYTLDHKNPYTDDSDSCFVRPCPKNSYPGLWEVPLNSWKDDVSICNVLDSCTSVGETADAYYEFFMRNFNEYYEGNRAPFAMFIHSSSYYDYQGYDLQENRYAALRRFFADLRLKSDVYFVSMTQVIKWMQSPTSLDQLGTFEPWNC